MLIFNFLVCVIFFHMQPLIALSSNFVQRTLGKFLSKC